MMGGDNAWDPFDGLPDEVDERPSLEWVRRMNDLLHLMDDRWASLRNGTDKEMPLHIAASAVAIVRSGVMRLAGIDAGILPLEELTVALANAIDGKRDPLLKPLASRRQPGFRVRQMRGRAVLAVDLLIEDGVGEDEALRLVARHLSLLGVPAMSVRHGTVRDWRTNVKWNGSMPEEHAHYLSAKADIEEILEGLVQAGLGFPRLNREQLFRALFERTAEKERKFGV